MCKWNLQWTKGKGGRRRNSARMLSRVDENYNSPDPKASQTSSPRNKENHTEHIATRLFKTTNEEKVLKAVREQNVYFISNLTSLPSKHVFQKLTERLCQTYERINNQQTCTSRKIGESHSSRRNMIPDENLELQKGMKPSKMVAIWVL